MSKNDSDYFFTGVYVFYEKCFVRNDEINKLQQLSDLSMINFSSSFLFRLFLHNM